MKSCNKLLAGAALLIPLATAACGNISGGDTVRVAMHAQLENLDPTWTTAYITRNHGYLVYDTLFAMDQNLEPQPQMVESFSKSADQKTWTFKLRPGLKWHDGSPVTAEDCVASLQRWSKRDGMGQELFKDVSSLSAADANTIVMEFKSPNDSVLEALAKVSANVPFMMPKRIADTDPNTPIQDATGSGPYVFQKDKWVPGSKEVYIRNANYVPRTEKASMAAGGKVAAAKEIDWVHYRDQSEAAQALLKGDIDYIESPSTKLVPKLLGKDHVVVANTDPLGNVAMMRFNSQQAPFNNAAVRRAVLMTINQADYMSEALGDKRFWRTCYSIYPCGTPFENEAGSSILKSGDLSAAQRALRSAGYKGETVVIMNPTDIPVISAMTKVTAEKLRSIGMNVEVRDMTWSTMLQKRTNTASVAEGGWSIFHTWWLANDVDDPLSIAFSGDSQKGWPGAPNDAQVENLRVSYVKTANTDQKQKIAVKLQERLLAIGAFGTLGQFYEPVAFRDNLTGITAPVQFPWTLAHRAKDKPQDIYPGAFESQFSKENIGY